MFFYCTTVKAPCVNGSGQPVVRQSHNNKQVQKLYEDYLGEPNSHKAHELLHTTYNSRERFPK